MKKVFLGGTCNESTWREKLIPMLNIDFFNPVVKDWNAAAQKEELKQRRECDFCLYTITPQMTGVYAIAEVVDDSNKQPDKTILCILEEFDGERFNEGQMRSLRQVAQLVHKNGADITYQLKDVNKIICKKVEVIE